MPGQATPHHRMPRTLPPSQLPGRDRSLGGLLAHDITFNMAARRISQRLLSQLQQRGPSSWYRQADRLPVGGLQLVSWLSTSAPASVDATEVAKALRCQQFLAEDLQPLRTKTSALPHSQLLDYMQQR